MVAALTCGLGAVAASHTSTWDSKNKMFSVGYNAITTQWKN